MLKDFPLETVVQLLRRYPIFADLPERDIASLAHLVRFDRYEREALVFYQGEAAERVYFLHQGCVKIVHHEPDGREVILEIILPGEVFGGGALLFAQHPATARALGSALVASLYCEHYMQFLQEHPAATIKMIRMLGARLLATTGQQILTGERMERRLARTLLRLADRVGRADPAGVLITIPLSRQNLADMTGATLETAIRMMSRFQKDGIIETRRGGYILIIDRQSLELMCT
jgi:CRP/FNR family transcriptional regulator